MSASAPRQGNNNLTGVQPRNYPQSAQRFQYAQQGQSSSSISSKGLVLFACLGIAVCYGAYKFLQGRGVNVPVNQEEQILDANLVNKTVQNVANFAANIAKNITQSTIQVVKNVIHAVNDTVKEPTKVVENLAAKAVNIASNVGKAPELSEETTEKCGFIAKKIIECGCDIRKSCAAIIRCMDKCKESCKQSNK